MSIGAQYAGIDIKTLIGSPLSAAAEAGVFLAGATADFIGRVGFDHQQKARTVSFKYRHDTQEPDGSVRQEERVIDVPLLAIVPIPNLQIDEINLLFDMEVKQCEKNDNLTEAGGTLSGRAGLGAVSATVSGSVSSRGSSTRSTDNSAKYHIDVKAASHGIPEGLARVLDIMAATVAPRLIGTSVTDESGNPLTGVKKSRNDALRVLREKEGELNPAEKAAEETFYIKMRGLIDAAERLKNADSLAAYSDIEKMRDTGADAKSKTVLIDNAIQKINGVWETFTRLVDSAVKNQDGLKLHERFTLYKYAPGGGVEALNESNGLSSVARYYSEASEAYQKLSEIRDALEKARLDYNNALVM